MNDFVGYVKKQDIILFGLKCNPRSYNVQEATAFMSIALTNGLNIKTTVNNVVLYMLKQVLVQPPPPPPNAFVLMIAAAKDAVAKDIPQVSFNPKSSLDKLRMQFLDT